ncbi:MAG: recombinase family protein, partial [Actinomycetota bacterium]
MEPSKAVMYARVSTREQADSGYSIESQTKLLKDYARTHDLEIMREFTDVESAKGTGRPQFAEMRKYLAINRSVKTILCEKTDRLYRNFSDYVDLDVDQGDLTVVLVKENTILNRESRSHEKLVHGFKVLLAKNYIDNLREETAKGMLEKAQQGEFPDRAPLGYKNNKETHRIDVVPEQA